MVSGFPLFLPPLIVGIFTNNNVSFTGFYRDSVSTYTYIYFGIVKADLEQFVNSNLQLFSTGAKLLSKVKIPSFNFYYNHFKILFDLF